MASTCGASRGVSAAIVTSTFSSHQPCCATRCATSARSRIESAPRYCSSVAGNSVPRSGRPAGPRRASATACATASPSECPASRHASAMVTPPSTRGGAAPNGCTSKPIPTRLRVMRAAPSIKAWASSRSATSVSLRLLRFPLDDHDGSAGRFDERGVVGPDALGRVRGFQRGAAKRLRRLHGDEVVARHGLDDDVVAHPLHRVGHGHAGYRRVRTGAHRGDDAGEQARATRADAPRRARRRRRHRRECSPGRPERMPTGSHRRRPRAHPQAAATPCPRATPRRRRHTTRARHRPRGRERSRPRDGRTVLRHRSANRLRPRRRSPRSARRQSGPDRPQQGGPDASTGHLRTAGYASSRRANSKRPAAVGTTDVTCNITSGPPTSSWPPLTTTMEPSSR